MRRRSPRLNGYDCSAPGPYFVTTCTRNRECVLAFVAEEDVVLTHLGRLARESILEIPVHFPGASVDSLVIMPNHVHLLLRLDGAGVALGTVVGAFKAAVARSARARGLWQRGYYDHVIRDEADLARVREYIATNPIRWALDPENPERDRP